MINIIHADIYRIFRGKGIYITIAVYIFFIILQIASGNTGTIGINIKDYDLHPGELILTGMNAPIYAMKTTDNLLYFLLPLIMMTAATDFSTGAIKNTLSGGISRISLYLTKLMLACLLCIGLALLNVIVPIIIGTIINGFGGSFSGEFILSILKPFSFQLLLLLSAASVCVFLVFTTKNAAAVNGIYIAFCLIPAIIVLMISEFSDKFLNLIKYDITMSLKMFSNYSTVTADDKIRTFIIVGFYILVSTIGGIALFKKAEIK